VPSGLVTRAVAGFFDVSDESGTRLCRARGVFRKRGINVLVGDRVEYEPIGATEGVITHVYPRKTELIRPPVANVDQALLVFSVVSPDFQSYLLDSLLVNVVASGLEPVIVFTKCDLAEDAVIASTRKPYVDAGYTVLRVSAKEGMGISDVLRAVEGRVSVMAGPSGAGKSTLANAISPELGLKMGEISEKLGRGRHTTRHVELFRLNQNTYIADAPGFSQLDVTVQPPELRDYFPEFRRPSEQCPYRGCFHSDEEDCGVKRAVDAGEISRERYQNYRTLLSELREREVRKY
jgi:ribosome biogenesis GTPase / thiamine phosphate phosphatase